MARWLVEATLYRTYHGGLYTTVFMGVGGLLMSLCGAILMLSMCSFCYTRKKQVGDKASSSDGDASPPKPALAPSKMNSEYNLNIIREEEKENEAFNREQQPGKSPPVWQRTILMGERCQRPTFSGLVLYDEKGNPLPRRFPGALEQAKM
eukprot:c15491_g1_i1 orf=246-695(+)